MMVLRHEVGHSTIPQNYIYNLTKATFLLHDSPRHALKAKFYLKKMSCTHTNLGWVDNHKRSKVTKYL